ncbi:cytochrome [Xanthomonas translucens pv. arrhenatheri]|uniref:Cytochrome P450 n=1 Tax=Xanthomonas graminis pv. arrhenatheri LMG 727 TaxID=1195923 RepID=A0A0K2ZU74_9XANT|nr:cytochrome P450 [Xanthomonas translucens]OAX67197.1 cytochrome [Xanthomonas translucens pv. arrhenatheri]UKE79602.1 cytochrome P450 [Xanthomonas translucens pv. arrhenatheri]CTP87699.1 hypothetical protein XTALMG727_2115 [Xanthomonas translucens pv. arrhenatheri LMG 727]
MSATIFDRDGCATVLAPRLQALLSEHVGHDAFRLDADTVGVAGPALVHRLLGVRPATEHERAIFKPLQGRSIAPAHASKLMQAIGRDVREALKRPVPADLDLSGPWPHVGHIYLRDLLLGSDPARLRLMMHPALELIPSLTKAVIAADALLPLAPSVDASSLAALTAAKGGYRERRYAMGMYRRVAKAVCLTISTLVANALWLGSPFDAKASNRNILYEAMRLLPPSWSMLRNASPHYAALDRRIGATDDVLVLPLLSHRDPALWHAPEVFLPQRWEGLDADKQPGYLPFGHASERCWARHMVMPLAESLLDLLRRQGLVASPRQRRAEVPLAALLGVARVAVVRQ